MSIHLAVIPRAYAQDELASPAGKDFHQAANIGPPVGSIDWIGSTLNSNKAIYYEGVSVPQRLILTGIPVTTGNVHVLTFAHQATKGNVHAYDFLTSWQQAKASADTIAPGQDILSDLFTSACDAGSSMTATPVQCMSLRTGPHSLAFPAPDAMGTVGGGLNDVAARIAAYEAAFGNRTLTIYGNASIVSASISFDGHTAGGDADADYTLTWESASTQVLIEFAGHLSVSEDNAGGAGIGFGVGWGSANISGGPYHITLGDLDGASLGTDANSIQGSQIIEPFCVYGVCDDGIPCTIDTCDEAARECVNSPDDSACDNGLYCDGAEYCDSLLDCQSGAAPNCSDGVGCTVDACDENADTCTSTPNSALCSNGQYCDGEEVCDANLDCQPGTAPNCDDGVSCTTDACDEGINTCTHTPVDGVCDDTLYCNGAETCDPTGDCQAGTPPNCNDGVSCTVDACDEGNDTCTHTANDGLCDDALYCTGVETCDALSDCQAGTPPNCNDGVTCTVDSCDEANDTCSNVSDDSLCDDGAHCNGAETCDATNDCQAGAAPNCDDGISCTVDSCDEAGDTCVNAPNHGSCDDGQPCTDDSCVPGVGCVSTPDDSNVCSDGGYCNGVETCASGSCQPGNDPCDDGVGCTVDACDEATDSCSHTPDNSLCDDALYCNGSETCGLLSDCQPGTSIDCSSLDDQCNDGVCDEGLDACAPQPTNENLPCNDSLYCTVDEVCVSGTCGNGDPRDCDDGVGCTVDTCDEDADQCGHGPDDASCSNGLFCDGEEFCDVILDCQDGDDPCMPPLQCEELYDICVDCLNDGQCDDDMWCSGVETCVSGYCQPGTPPCGSDGVSCTVDGCDDGSDICTHVPDDGFCGDGQHCNGTEFCDPVNDCESGPSVDCDDGVSCTIDSCDEATDQCDHTADDSLCDDALYCTGVETCHATNDCQSGTSIDCSHLDDQCNYGACDDALDACARQATSEGADCDDGDFCSVGEVCGSGTCNSGVARDCDDAVACTIDTCDEGTDQCLNSAQDALCDDDEPCTDDACDALLGCVFTPDDSNSCDDGLFCNGAERCSGGVVQAGPEPCDDGVSCTTDICDEDTDSCTHLPDDGVCSDGQFCNGSEVCDVANDCGPGTAPNCDDTVSCTIDSCDETNDQCVNAASDDLCSDGLYCNGAETCDTLADCQAGQAPNCDDGVICTLDSCDEDNDQCVNVASDSLCDDAQYCNGVETCDSVNDCQSGAAPNCDDGIPCTADDCDEITDACTHAPNDAVCSDGQYCNGQEICDVNIGCSLGTSPNCTDGVSCTVDACDEQSDTCTHSPDDALCNNGAHCDGVETCHVVNDCQDGAPPNCDDTFACTVDSCDEISNSCTHTPFDTVCTDGLFCNGEETCSLTVGCQAGSAPDCGDGVGCTVDSCDETDDQCVNTPSDALCADNLSCNGVETCNPTNDCQAGTPVSCPDNGLACDGAESCQEPSGTCASGPALCDPASELCCEVSDACVPAGGCCDDSECPDDGNYCNGDEVCSGGSCISTGDPCAGTASPLCCEATSTCAADCCDSGDCTDPGACLEATCDAGACLSTATACAAGQQCCTASDSCAACCNDADCGSNAFFCDGEETCVGGTCQTTGNPCPTGQACCEDRDICAADCGNIPTVSQWGMITMALLLLVGGKLYYGRRSVGV